jgi:hypothetical protein
VSSERCAVCRLPADRRVDLESAYSIALGSDDVAGEVLAVAELFSVSRAALQRHREHAKVVAKARRAPPAPVPQEVVEEPKPPSSRDEPVVPELRGGLPDPEDGGSVLEHIRQLQTYLAVPNRTSDELAQAREVRQALMLKARVAGEIATRAKLHQHPDWPAFVEKVLDAVESTDPLLALHRLLQVQGDDPAQEAA